MIRKASLLPGLAALALALGVTACSPNSDSNNVHAQETATVVAQPTVEGVLRRCAERWTKIVAAGEDDSVWIEIYDYETPARKATLSLPAFLSNKGDFVYKEATKPKLLLMEGEMAYLDTSAQWLAGRHPMIGSADIGGDTEMVEPMDMIETWQWINNEWHFVKPQDRNEFFRENPDFLARAQAASEKRN